MAADLQPILQANPQSREAKELLPSPKNQDQDLPEQVAFQAPPWPWRSQLHNILQR